SQVERLFRQIDRRRRHGEVMIRQSAIARSLKEVRRESIVTRRHVIDSETAVLINRRCELSAASTWFVRGRSDRYESEIPADLILESSLRPQLADDRATSAAKR